MDEDRDDALRYRVRQFKGRYGTLAKEAGVSYSWLQKFATGKLDCPRIDTKARLYVALESVGERVSQ